LAQTVTAQKTLYPAFERMQSKSRQVHMSNRRGGMKCRQNIPQLIGVFGVYAARVVVFKEPSQPLVADGPYHPAT